MRILVLYLPLLLSLLALLIPFHHVDCGNSSNNNNNSDTLEVKFDDNFEITSPRSVRIVWHLWNPIERNQSYTSENTSHSSVQYLQLAYTTNITGSHNSNDSNSNWIDLLNFVHPNKSGSFSIDQLNPATTYQFRLAIFDTSHNLSSSVDAIGSPSSPSSTSLLSNSTSISLSSVTATISDPNNSNETSTSKRFSSALDNQLSSWSYINITMPPDVPPPVTQLHVLSKTNKTVWIGWRKPAEDNGADIIEYQLELWDYDDNLVYNESQLINREATGGSRNLMFMFVALEPATNYTVQVRACSSLGCGQWSKPKLHVRTSDGIAGPPQNVSINCFCDLNKSTFSVNVSWEPVLEPRGTVIGFNITLLGSATFRNQDNQFVSDNSEQVFHVDGNQTNLQINIIVPNTNYSVKVCAINKAGCGELSSTSSRTICSSCPSLPVSLPSGLALTLENPGDPFCHRLKLKLPRISERNGQVKCYRIVIIKLPKNVDHNQILPINSSDVNITSYSHVHSQLFNDRQNNSSSLIGAYIAEEISPDNLDYDIIIGDEDHSMCEDVRTPRRIGYVPTVDGSYLPTPTSSSYSSSFSTHNFNYRSIEDGFLDASTNYTGFLEIRVLGQNETYLYKQSDYFIPILTGAIDPRIGSSLSSFSPIFSSFSEPAAAVLFGIVCGLTLVLISILSVICVLRKQVNDSMSDSGIDGGGDERLSLTSFFRRTVAGNKSGHIVSNGIIGSTHYAHKWIGQPIPIQNLPNVFIDRHANGDALFRSEFDSLPETFQDRTSRDCELSENRPKNRYPDIKCYDQTRVKLSPLDDTPGSDYINANFVEGYKGRKLYICAQGPLERTVSDFWWMIYEQKITVIVMLTKIEENGKIKCAQYWSDTGTKEIEKSFKVTLQSCVKYSDFIIRRFDLRLCSGEDEYSRDILHFHFLLWKDFLAPEQPSWLLRFVKRVNEHYCSDRGPLLIHCSAGVGRAGTFIAIDSLIPEITTGSTVNIFECVSKLRYQRNFLVQSLKQYIFVYRALMEFAQFGDTEIEICHLRDCYRQMKEQKFEGNINGVVAEFDRLNEVIEDAKSSCVGSLDMNMAKNRYNFIIPYDINRVILPPLPNKDNSTYINASFVQGYDRNLSFIVTQDPLEKTIPDFWRMIYEQKITTIVMLSEIGEGQSKCPIYWPQSGTITHEDVDITFLEKNDQNEQYTIRKFSIKNSKNDPFIFTHYHFLSWKSRVVPETTLPLIKLIDESLRCNSSSSSPMVVHCTGGGDRSSLFVTMSSLIQQMSTDGRVDIFQTARYTRSQRPCMLQTIAQYDFIYRCLTDYIESHNLCDSMSDTQL
ncbi:protein tyrosine phosphatase 69D isoform X2 [Brevipalpus obovatus]|uniref:protein tyrosine phosphatase 69D isoform X2 n=1 Tax=Brevipalpus obovatus TaxID=246614 RepID=UPI003D9ECF1B